jgi:hypothetical protein
MRWPLLLLLLGCGTPDAGVSDAGPVDATPLDAAGQGAAPRGAIAINEVFPAGAGEDWLELTNRSDTAVDLSGWFVSDAPDRLDHYLTLPAGTVLAPGAYLTVYADDGLPGEGLHAPFKLSRADGVVVLDDRGIVADQVLFLAADTGLSLARRPDGEGLFFALPPSFGTVNP